MANIHSETTKVGAFEPQVEITLSMNLLDQADSLRGAAQLWLEWSREDGRASADVDAWINELLTDIQKGFALPIVAYTEWGEPVGMVTAYRGYNAASGRIRASFDRLYVTPKHRDMSVFRALWAACEAFSDLIGAGEEMISCAYGSPLQRWYERAGFKTTDIVLRREV